MSEKSQKSTESVSSANSSEVLKAPRVKRTFTAQFKEEALAMLSGQGLSVAEAARRLGVHQNLLRKWRNMAQVAGPMAFQGLAQPSAIEEENRQLREENARLRMERDILKKATVFFAKESRRDSPSSSSIETCGRSRSIALCWRYRGAGSMPGEVASRARPSCAARP